MTHLVSRRGLLKGMAAASVTGAAAALGWPLGAPAVASPAELLRRAGARPFPGRPAGADMLGAIRHIVVVMMENHSFDNYFGMLGRGDGFTLDSAGRPTNSNPGPDGTPVSVFPSPSVCQSDVDISQDWRVSHHSWGGGRNDGFVTAKGSTTPMGYYTAADLPYYHSLGRTFVLCDRWFSSTMAQTDPNRRFLMAASAFGLVDDTFPGGATTSLRPTGFGTVFEMLSHFSIPWRNYYSNLPSSLLFPYLASSQGAHMVPVADYFRDAAAGTLPAFSLVDPDFAAQSEENPQDVQNGEQFAASVIDAAMAGPGWPHTVLIWLYDEHGGYYDHVAPRRTVRPDGIAPDVAPDQLDGDLYSWTGFRVPAVVVSPWARRDYVSHVAHDHTSVLKLLETKWNLPALSDRDANASNLLDTLDLGAARPPFLDPPDLHAPVAVTAATVDACSAASAPGT